MPKTRVARALRWVRSQVRGVPSEVLIWTLIACSATLCLLKGLRNRHKYTEPKANASETANNHTETTHDSTSDHLGKTDEQQEEEGVNGEDSEDEVEEGDTGEKGKVTDDEENEEEEGFDEEEEEREKDDNLRKRKF